MTLAASIVQPVLLLYRLLIVTVELKTTVNCMLSAQLLQAIPPNLKIVNEVLWICYSSTSNGQKIFYSCSLLKVHVLVTVFSFNDYASF